MVHTYIHGFYRTGVRLSAKKKDLDSLGHGTHFIEYSTIQHSTIVIRLVRCHV